MCRTAFEIALFVCWMGERFKVGDVTDIIL